MAEDRYLNWQLCCAWFCYNRNISFIQALRTNLQLGNMNVFIHCVLDPSNHPDNNLKSWTGKVGSGSPRLRSDPAARCRSGREQPRSSLEIRGRRDLPPPHAQQVSEPSCCLRSELLSAGPRCAARQAVQDWQCTGWLSPVGDTNGNGGSGRTCKVAPLCSFEFPRLGTEVIKVPSKLKKEKITALFYERWSCCSLDPGRGVLGTYCSCHETPVTPTWQRLLWGCSLSCCLPPAPPPPPAPLSCPRGGERCQPVSLSSTSSLENSRQCIALELLNFYQIWLKEVTGVQVIKRNA